MSKERLFNDSLERELSPISSDEDMGQGLMEIASQVAMSGMDDNDEESMEMGQEAGTDLAHVVDVEPDPGVRTRNIGVGTNTVRDATPSGEVPGTSRGHGKRSSVAKPPPVDEQRLSRKTEFELARTARVQEANAEAARERKMLLSIRKVEAYLAGVPYGRHSNSRFSYDATRAPSVAGSHSSSTCILPERGSRFTITHNSNHMPLNTNPVRRVRFRLEESEINIRNVFESITRWANPEPTPGPGQSRIAVSTEVAADFGNVGPVPGPSSRAARDPFADSDPVLYCLCRHDASYGQMMACENPHCPIEWFHVGCMGYTSPPPPGTRWYCPICMPDVHIPH